ncbi:hypothetical protein PPS11_40555 [Pseudomonas putida S11]|nr:hypothetical protein PPS11_40555 [Pseudomonas putida S11]
MALLIMESSSIFQPGFKIFIETCTMGTRFFLLVQWGRKVLVTNHVFRIWLMRRMTLLLNIGLRCFQNGGGDYVAVNGDKDNDTEGLIWWHEDPMVPELGIDIFEVMDAWMAIFLEDTKPRDELIAKLR